jgi:predicted Zn-dependent protease with MMP-like domain
MTSSPPRGRRELPSPARAAQPPTLDDLEAIGREALKTIPEELRVHVGNVVLRVDEFPDEATEEEMGLESPFDLLGLYRGVSLNRKGGGTPHDVDMIFLYRRPILDYWCETGEDLVHLVRHVLIHEIGHHFGFSDDDMMRIEAS